MSNTVTDWGFLMGAGVHGARMASVSGFVVAQVLNGAVAADLAITAPAEPSFTFNRARTGLPGVELGIDTVVAAERVYTGSARGCPPATGGLAPACLPCPRGTSPPASSRNTSDALTLYAPCDTTTGTYKAAWGSTVCMPCPRDRFPAPNRTACLPCPGAETKCVQGIVHFAPNVYAPPEVRGLPVQPDTPLYKCPRRGTCVVNTTREDGVVDMRCKEGYVGPACSVCDVEGG